MKIVIDLSDRDYELLKNAGITIDFNTLFHGKEKDRELTFSTFNLIESLKNGTPYEEPKKNCVGCQGDKDFGCEDCLNKPKNDCISRKQVLDELLEHQYSQDFCKEHGIEYSIHSGMVRIIVNRAPTVEPKKTQGEWVWVQYDADTNIGDFYCSACRYIPKDLKGRYKSYIQYSSMNYCPNCGADMRKEAKNDK